MMKLRCKPQLASQRNRQREIQQRLQLILIEDSRVRKAYRNILLVAYTPAEGSDRLVSHIKNYFPQLIYRGQTHKVLVTCCSRNKLLRNVTKSEQCSLTRVTQNVLILLCQIQLHNTISMCKLLFSLLFVILAISTASAAEIRFNEALFNQTDCSSNSCSFEWNDKNSWIGGRIPGKY